MPTLKVAIPFRLAMDPVNPDGTPRDPTLPTTYVFPTPGTYDVPDEVGQHWYTAPHLEGYEQPTVQEATGVTIMEPIPEDPDPGPGDTTGGAMRGGAQRQADPRAAAAAGAAAAADTKHDSKR